MNQIAKATNTTGVIYKNEIESMNKQIEKLSKRNMADPFPDIEKIII